MTEKPLVSVGVPVYNGERTLRQTLDSLLGQTYDNLELIICDNRSGDDTSVICREYAARDPRVKYFLNDQNVGCQPNFNRVLELATGEYFMWTSADDLRPPKAVANLVEALQSSPQAVLAHGPILAEIRGFDGLVEVRNEMDLLADSAAKRVATFTQRLKHNGMNYSLCRRSVLTASEARLGSNYGNDYLFCLKLCFLGPAAWIDQPMVMYRQKPGCPIDEPMYTPMPVSLWGLFRYRGVRRKKCWVVLLLGIHDLLCCPGTSLTQRLGGAGAYIRSFVARYRQQLASEALFLIATPAAWLADIFLPAGRRLRQMMTRSGMAGG
jgi:glycosyltransferase involved in cell wall biosynthesis